jgi:predicted dehydrogenase
LLSLGTHDISILLELAGDQPQVRQAQAWNYSNNVQPDRIWFAGNINDSVTFDVDVSWHWPVRTRQTIIIGTTGQITWDQDANTITITRNIVKDRRAIVDTTPEVREYSYELTPLEAELKHWVDCLITRQEPATGLQAAKQVALVIHQVKELL